MKPGKKLLNMKMNMKMIVVMTVVMLGVTVLCVGCGSRAPGPNIVLIVLDTLRADHLPFYGYPENTAPFLSDLASKGVVFENTYAASSWTAPATASIFTAMYPFQHGVTTGFFASRALKLKINRIPGKAETLVEILQKNGYRTYGAANNVNIRKKMGFAQGFDRFKLFRYVEGHTADIDRKLKKWAPEITGAGKKYFLYIHFNDCHKPLHKRKPWYREDKKRTWKENEIAAYNSEISYVDRKIEKLFHLYGWDKNTLVIVTADHGEEFWEHGKKGHGSTLYTEVIKVPLLFYFPSQEGYRRRIAVNAANIDILPTLCGYLGLPAPRGIAGMDLMPLIRGDGGTDGENKLGERYLFSHLYGRYGKRKVGIHRATIYRNWKHISFSMGKKHKREFYNLATDPFEGNNLLTANEKRADLLLFKYVDFEKKSKKIRPEQKTFQLSDRQKRDLKTLGYVE